MRTVTPTVYIVHWRSDQIVKVGFTSGARWRAFVARGADVVALLYPLDAESAFSLEVQLEEALAAVCEPAFADRHEAMDHVGPNGCGWSECYRLPGPDLPAAFSELIRSESDRIA